jgi:serine protease Do
MRFAWLIVLFLGSLPLLLGASPVLEAVPGPADHGEAAQRFAAGIERAKRATVGILQSEGPDARGLSGQGRFSVRGTGLYVRDGYIVTARHAVEAEEAGKSTIPQEIRILTTDLEELPAKLTGVNAFLDIAVYRVSLDGTSARMAAAAFAQQEPEPGEELFTVGYPLGWGPAVGFGRLGNPNTFLPTVDSRLFQLDLSACSGNSGGGLFNAGGEIVGVMHAIIQTETIQGERRCSRFGFAVPGRLVQRISEALIRGERPSFSRLGVQLRVEKRGTRWVAAVAEASGPALDGGIQKGDILIAIESAAITDAAQLKNYLIERTEPGQRVTVRVLRGDAERDLVVTLGGS